MSKLLRYTLLIGETFLYLTKLHILAILHILKGGILFGIFPSISTIWHIYFSCFKYKTLPFPICFSILWKHYFKLSNIIGYLFTCLLCFIYIEFRIAFNYFYPSILFIFLFIVFFIILGCTIFIFPSLIRYNLTFTQHIKQSFFLLLCSLSEYLAILMGAVVILVSFILFPLIFIFASIPLSIFPSAWFTYQAVLKLEENQNKEELS